MRWLIVFVLLALAGAASASETYRWVDENGVVNFSDTPHPGAERVDLEGIETTRFAAPRAAPTTTAETAEAAAGGAVYESIAISRPQSEETIWNTEGFLDVQISVQPSIRSDDRLRLYLDGQEVAGVPARATSFTIDKVFRGMHTLRAVVEDRNGRQLVTSDTVRFYVRQTSIQNPNRPARPTPRPRG